jgi:hypothetical protein
MAVGSTALKFLKVEQINVLSTQMPSGFSGI